MSTYRYRTYAISRDDISPGGFHGALPTDPEDCCSQLCRELTETDDGCACCQEEMDAADELLAKQRLDEGYDVWDCMLSNDPWTNSDEPWEFWVKERKVRV